MRKNKNNKINFPIALKKTFLEVGCANESTKVESAILS